MFGRNFLYRYADRRLVPADAAPPPAEGVRTLEEVRALKPEDDQPLDLYRFHNPVKVESNRLSRSWSEPRHRN